MPSILSPLSPFIRYLSPSTINEHLRSLYSPVPRACFRQRRPSCMHISYLSWPRSTSQEWVGQCTPRYRIRSSGWRWAATWWSWFPWTGTDSFLGGHSSLREWCQSPGTSPSGGYCTRQRPSCSRTSSWNNGARVAWDIHMQILDCINWLIVDILGDTWTLLMGLLTSIWMKLWVPFHFGGSGATQQGLHWLWGHSSQQGPRPEGRTRRIGIVETSLCGWCWLE